MRTTTIFAAFAAAGSVYARPTGAPPSANIMSTISEAFFPVMKLYDWAYSTVGSFNKDMTHAMAKWPSNDWKAIEAAVEQQWNATKAEVDERWDAVKAGMNGLAARDVASAAQEWPQDHELADLQQEKLQEFLRAAMLKYATTTNADELWAAVETSMSDLAARDVTPAAQKWPQPRELDAIQQEHVEKLRASLLTSILSQNGLDPEKFNLTEVITDILTGTAKPYMRRPRQPETDVNVCDAARARLLATDTSLDTDAETIFACMLGASRGLLPADVGHDGPLKSRGDGVYGFLPYECSTIVDSTCLSPFPWVCPHTSDYESCLSKVIAELKEENSLKPQNAHEATPDHSRNEDIIHERGEASKEGKSNDDHKTVPFVPFPIPIEPGPSPVLPPVWPLYDDCGIVPCPEADALEKREKKETDPVLRAAQLTSALEDTVLTTLLVQLSAMASSSDLDAFKAKYITPLPLAGAVQAWNALVVPDDPPTFIPAGEKRDMERVHQDFEAAYYVRHNIIERLMVEMPVGSPTSEKLDLFKEKFVDIMPIAQLVRGWEKNVVKGKAQKREESACTCLQVWQSEMENCKVCTTYTPCRSDVPLFLQCEFEPWSSGRYEAQDDYIVWRGGPDAHVMFDEDNK